MKKANKYKIRKTSSSFLSKRKSTGAIPCFSSAPIENRTKRRAEKKLKYEQDLRGDGDRLRQIGSSSPRSISIDQLHALLRFHLRPIKLVVYK